MTDTYWTDVGAPERYPDDMPGDVAGQAGLDALFDPDNPPVTTTHGREHGFSGDDLETPDVERVAGVGYEQVDERIGKVVKDAQARDRGRRPVNTTAQVAVYGTFTFPDGNARRILLANDRRARLVLGNPGASVVSVGNAGGLAIGGPNTQAIPVAGSREYRHTQDVWVVGAANAVVDWCEELYAE